jgi:hypothetical protein
MPRFDELMRAAAPGRRGPGQLARVGAVEERSVPAIPVTHATRSAKAIEAATLDKLRQLSVMSQQAQDILGDPGASPEDRELAMQTLSHATSSARAIQQATAHKRATLRVVQPGAQDIRAHQFRSQYGAQALAAAARAGREVLDVDPNYTQDVEMPISRRDPLTGRVTGDLELLERMPETDFAPEHITDPRARLEHKRAYRRREMERAEGRRSETQLGGQAPGILPGQTATVARWFAIDAEEPQDINLTLTYTIDDVTKSCALGSQYTVVAPTGGTLQQGVQSITPTPGAGPAATDYIGLYAQVDWSIGPNSFTAIVDFQYGTQLRLTATQVTIRALYLPQSLPSPWPSIPIQGSGIEGATTGPPVTAACAFGHGFPSFRTAAARFTRRFGLNASGGVPDTLKFDPIPPWASAFGVSVLAVGVGDPSTTAPNLDIVVATQNQVHTGGNCWAFNISSGVAQDNEFLLPSGSRFLWVQNKAANAVEVAVVYALMI